MKHALIISVLMLPTASFAVERVWYCQETASAGLKWVDGEYKNVEFKLGRYTIKQEGMRLIFPEEMALDPAITRCHVIQTGGNLINCRNDFVQFLLNVDTGKVSLAYSAGLALGFGSSGSADSLSVSALTCETF